MLHSTAARRYTYPSDTLDRHGDMGYFHNAADDSPLLQPGFEDKYQLNQMPHYTDAQRDVDLIFSEPAGGLEQSGGQAHRLRGSEVVGSAHRLAAEVEATLQQIQQEDLEDAAKQQAVKSPSTPNKSLKRPATTSAEPGPTGSKSNKGLRHFSRQVVEKLSQKGQTTYLEVADELVREGKEQAKRDRAMGLTVVEDDEKNIRRRVYDALNVLKALGAIHNEKKDISWMGLSNWQMHESNKRVVERDNLSADVQKKNEYLQDLVDQYKALCNLLKRNCEHSASHANASKISLPFVIVQTSPNAIVEVDISDDERLAHFNFNETPFQIHDDTFVLKNLGLCATRSNLASPSLASPGYPHGPSQMDLSHS